MRKTKIKNRIIILLLCFITIFTSVPMDSFAVPTENHAPEFHAAYESGLINESITTDESFVLDLKEVFTDADDDELTYFVKLGDMEYRKTEHKCMYKPDSTGEVNIAFKASDEKSESEELKVKIDVTVGSKNSIQSLGINEEKHQLSSLIVHTGASTTAANAIVLVKNKEDELQSNLIFDSEKLEYTLSGEVYDTQTSLGFRAVTGNENLIATLHWGKNQTADVTWTSGLSKIQKDFLSAGKKEFSIIVSRKDGTNSSLNTTYKFSLDVKPTLSSLSAENGMYWNREFEPSVKEYTLSVPETAKKITLNATALNSGCMITYNGKKGNTVNISNVNDIEVAVAKDDVTNIYTVHLEKKKVYSLQLETIPSDATVVVYDHKDAKVPSDKSNQYSVMSGDYKYNYTVSADGYISKLGILPAQDGKIKVSLSKVTGKQPDTDVDVDWKNFRNSDYNMAITNVNTPKNEDVSKVTPKWIQSFDNEKPSIQIIVDNALVVMAGNTLYKLDLDSGEILQQTEMASTTGYGYTPMTYAEGMIFCPLTGGTIQAFNAKTLESLWVYKDELGGQTLSPITYSDGYIYTGLWRGEKLPANYVCLSILDEDVNKKTERKQAVWTYTHDGGFYWAGAVVIGDSVIVGSDDGDSEGSHASSYLYAFNKKNGDVLSKTALQSAGDQRSSIAYSKEKDKIYFTTKGGYLYSANVNNSTGKISNLKGKSFGLMSTSTPVVYKDRVYFGVGKSLSSGCFAVADANTLELLFTVDMKGYPQCSMLLSTAYVESTGYIYLYSTYNNKPGGISVLKVKADCKTAVDVTLTELYNADGYSEYCITSLICGEDGTLYYKNDTGNVFAIGIPSYENVISLIDEIGDVTLQSEGNIKAARAAYDALSNADKQKVTNYKALTEAEKEYKSLVNANYVVERINSIGRVTLNSNEKISAARKAYDLLTAADKLLVFNRNVLEESEDKYDSLVKKAINEVENAIYDIGTVTLDSRGQITKARTAYEELPAHLKEKIHNLDILEDAEAALKKLLGQQKNKKEETSKGNSVGNNASAPSKSKVLLLQEKFNQVNDNITYEDALALVEEYDSLNESGQLALEDTDAMRILQKIIGDKNHTDEKTGLCVEGAEWRIRLVVTESTNEEIEKEIKQKVTDKTLLEMWDIYLEDCITGEKYQPQETITIKIPLKVISSHDIHQKYSIVHYTAEEKIEIFNCKEVDNYLTFEALEFSIYGVMSSEKNEQMPEMVKEELNSTELDGQEEGPSWIIWLALAGAGTILLLLMVLLKKTETEEELNLSEDNEE